MEIGASTRISALAGIGELRPPPAVPPEAVRSDLPKDAAVQPPPALVRPDADPSSPDSQPPAAADVLKRQNTIDIATHKVIYEAIDQRTGEVVFQVPDLRYLKAYADQQKAAGAADGEDASGHQVERVA